MTSHTKKTISWLLVSAIIIAGCGYFETGNIIASLMASFWACVLKTPVYWIHEILWNKKEKLPHVPVEIVCQACNEAFQAN